MNRMDRPRWGDPDLTRFEPTDPDATRYEGSGAEPDATRYEGQAAEPDATRYEGSAGGSSGPLGVGGPAAGWTPDWPPEELRAQFEFVRTLSREGGQADVYLCRARASGEQVAVKLYRKRPRVDRSTYDRLGRIAAAHVTPTRLEIGEHATWEVQEYFSHGSLHDLIQRRGGGAQSPAFVWAVLQEIAAALQALHAESVTHRDLKPGNVFVRSTEPLDLVLGDFGFARDLAMSAELMSIAGSYHYTAPEVMNVGEVSPAADWWSLGVIVFELLTGHTPFVDEAGRRQTNHHRVRADVVRGEYSLAEVTDARWSLLLRGLLNRSRKHRWAEPQVRDWLAGGTPEVVEEPDSPAEPTLAPIVLPWGEFTQPSEAVRSLASHWSDACDYLTGQGSTHLRLWLGPLSQSPRVDALLRAVHDQGMSPDEALVSLQLLLDPEQPVVFRNRTVDEASLADVARRAAAGDQPAQAWLRALRRNQVLGSMAAQGRGGPALSRADLRLKQWGDRLDQIVKQAQGDATLRAHVPSLEGLTEGTLVAAALDPAQVAPHVRAGQQAAARLTTADPEPLRQWASAVKERGGEALPEALALTLLGGPAVADRLAKAKAAADAAAKARRDARLREIRGQVQPALRLVRSRVLWSLVPLVGLVLLLGDLSSPARWAPTAVTLGVPLAVSIGIAFAADLALPRQRRARASFALGAAVLLWQVFWAFPYPVSTPGWWLATIPVVQAPWFAGGYALGHVVAAVLARFPGRDGRAVAWPLRLLPWLALASTAVIAVLVKTRLPLTTLPPPGWWATVRGPLTIAPLQALPAEVMVPALRAIDVVSLVAVTLANETRTLGRSRQRVLWLVVNALALLAVLYRLPLLAAGWSLALGFLVIAGGVAAWASWANEL
nr:serine/threonine-protein kinase [Propionibacterium sp.]